MQNKDIPLPLIKSAAVATTTALLLYLATPNIFSLRPKSDEDSPPGELPTPKNCLPLIGHLLSIGTKPHEAFNKWTKELGKIYRVKMGKLNWVIISDPYLAREAFMTNGAHTLARPKTVFLQHYSHDYRGVVFSPPGKYWTKTRAAVLSALHPNEVKKFLEGISEEADALLKMLISETEKNEYVNPAKQLGFYSANNILKICLGKGASSMEDPDFIELDTKVKELLSLGQVGKNLADVLPAPFSYFNIFKSDEEGIKKAVEEKDILFKRLIDEADKRDNSSIMQWLANKKHGMEDLDRRCILSDIILAGTDTTSATLNWLFAILCNHPDIQRKVQAELDEFMDKNGHLPKMSDSSSVVYCMSVMKETLRYRPTSPLGLPREVDADIVVGGYLIKKGYTIIGDISAMHKDERLYENPESFNPDRFKDDKKSLLESTNGNFEQRDQFSFGWGKRVCPGLHLAECEVFSALVKILYECDIKPAINEDGEEVYPDIDNFDDDGVVRRPLPANYRFIKRNKN